MKPFVKLYSNLSGEISKFLSSFYNCNINDSIINVSTLEWQKDYDNPIEMADIIGVFVDNQELYNINMWVSIDENVLINVTKDNINDIICYLYERFPY